MALTTLTVGVTSYSSAQRAAMGLVLDSLTISVDEYSELAFTVFGCGPLPPFLAGQPVALLVDFGSGPVVVFQGNIAGVSLSQGETGWVYAYHCLDLKHRADYISIQSANGRAACEYNLDVDDLSYDPTRAGKTVGEIARSVLEVYNTAQLLLAQSVGGYTFGSGVAMLNATTVSDLSVLTIVPHKPERLEGKAILSVVQSFIQQHYPQACLWVQADGIIRVRSPFTDFTTYTLKVPGTGQLSPDPVEWPEYEPITQHCHTQYQIIGQDLEGAILSTIDGTLTPFNSSGDRASWTIADHLFPKGTSVFGNLSVASSTSATITCDDPTVSWASGFWPSIGGTLYLINTGGAGFQLMSQRRVTISGALAAGGSCAVSWDSSYPLDFPSYNRFMLVGSNNSLAYVDRLFWVTDPSTGDTGLDTAIGANLEDRDPNGIEWSNNGQYGPIFYAAAKVVWGFNCDNSNPALRWPMQELPIGVKVIRSTGQILLDDPACLVAALAAGTADALQLGYPATALNGLWYGVVVAVPYSRGPLVAQYPASGYAGSAYTDYGIQRTHQEFLDSYTSRTQNVGMIALAQQKLISMQDAVLEGSIAHHGLPSFDCFVPGIGLNLVMPSTSPLDARPVPVRTTVIRWPADGPDIHQVSFRFSNRKAPFAGDDRYLHPHYTKDSYDTAAFFEAGFDPASVMDGWKSGMQGRGERQAAMREANRVRDEPTNWGKLAGGPDSLPAGKAINVDPVAPKLSQMRGRREDLPGGMSGGAP